MSLRKSLLSLRILAVLQSVLMLAQVALAGGFIGGHFDMLEMHSKLAGILVVVALLVSVAAFLVRRAGGPGSLFPPALGIFFVLVLQTALGMIRSVPLHVLLGSVLTAAVAVLSQRVMATPLPPAAGRPANEPVEAAR